MTTAHFPSVLFKIDNFNLVLCHPVCLEKKCVVFSYLLCFITVQYAYDKHFGWHSNDSRQSDAEQLTRHSLPCSWTSSLELCRRNSDSWTCHSAILNSCRICFYLGPPCSVNLFNWAFEILLRTYFLLMTCVVYASERRYATKRDVQPGVHGKCLPSVFTCWSRVLFRCRYTTAGNVIANFVHMILRSVVLYTSPLL